MSSWATRLLRLHPYYWAKRGHDEVQNGNEDLFFAGIRFDLKRQGYVHINLSQGHEPWLGQRFKTGGTNLFARGQVFRWLNINGSFNTGNAIFYDPVAPFQGKSRNASIGATLQPNLHFSQGIGVNTVRFDRESTGARVFSVDIVNLKTTYQFNKHFLVRLIEQYDSSSRRLLSDYLASYEFVPGTVLQAGYGSLIEKQVPPPATLARIGISQELHALRGTHFRQ